MITANVWNIFCFCSSLRYFLLLHCKVLHQAGYLLSCIGPMNFWTEVTRASISKYRPEPRHSWRTFCNHMLYACHQICTALTQPSSLNCNVCIHAVEFDLSSIHATSFKPLHPLSSTSTSSYSRRSSAQGAALIQQASCERSRRTQDME